MNTTMIEFHYGLMKKLANPTSLTDPELSILENILRPQLEDLSAGTFQVSDLDEKERNWVSTDMLTFMKLRKIDQDKVQRYMGYFAWLRKQLKESNQLTSDGYSANPLNPDCFKPYVGSHITRACPITRGVYNTMMGWNHPVNQNPNDKGMLYIQADGNRSWMLLEVFEKCFRADGNLNYGDAIHLLKAGERLMRSGWNGKNMFIETVPSSGAEVIRVNDQNVIITTTPGFRLVNLNAKIASPWHASVPDTYAKDWSVFPEED